MAKATGKLRQDTFYHMAKEQGYRSRAAMKLLQLNRSFRFLQTARAVLDLGAAPGGWLQVAVRGATPGAFVVGVDLARIRPMRGAISLKEDITATARCSAAVRRLMDTKGVTAFDVVLHDGVGQKKKRKRDGEEATRQSTLIIDAVRLATMFLAPKGAFVTKFVGPHDFKAIMFCLKQLFEKVVAVKPKASRSTLPELYIVCLEYKAPAKIQPEFFDLKHLLAMSKPRDEVRSPLESESRGITLHGSFATLKPGRALDFIWSEAQTLQELLGSFMGVSFDDPASLPIKNHKLTTAEIQMFCENLDILDKKTLDHIWEWRTRIRKALCSCSQVTPKPDITAVDAKVKDDGQCVDKTEELTSITGRKTRREKHQSSCGDKAHKSAGMQIDATEDSHCNLRCTDTWPGARVRVRYRTRYGFHSDTSSIRTGEHGKELRAVDSAELEMEDGIGDGGKEETQTHGGCNEEMDSYEEQHRYEGMIHAVDKGFTIKNGKVKQQHKHASPNNPYANVDWLEKPKENVVAKKRVHVRDCKGKALVDPWMKDGNTSGSEKKVGEEQAKGRSGRRAPQARKR